MYFIKKANLILVCSLFVCLNRPGSKIRKFFAMVVQFCCGLNCIMRPSGSSETAATIDEGDDNSAIPPGQSPVLCRYIVPVIIPRHGQFSIGCGKERTPVKRVSLTLLKVHLYSSDKCDYGVQLVNRKTERQSMSFSGNEGISVMDMLV